VHFIDLKDLYEKAQVRRKGQSEQRLVESRIHMVANFLAVPRSVQVWVQRFADIKGFQKTVQLPVAIEKTMPNMVNKTFLLDRVLFILGKPQLHYFYLYGMVLSVQKILTPESRANIISSLRRILHSNHETN
jgi:hypothetical protein